jgi:hypothetical protein
MKEAPVLHWPKLFEGKVWTFNGPGVGDGIGYGTGYGDDWGNSSFYISRGGGSYAGRGDGFVGDSTGYGLGNGDGGSR